MQRRFRRFVLDQLNINRFFSWTYLLLASDYQSEKGGGNAGELCLEEEVVHVLLVHVPQLDAGPRVILPQ